MDKVVVFADHTIGYNLTKFLLTDFNRNKEYTIEAVFTNERSESAWWPDLSQLLLNDNVPLRIYEEKRTVDFFNTHEVDFLLLLSWKHIIANEIITNVRREVVNLHYSLLPLHRGVYPVNWSINSGDQFTGITFHLVDSSLDGGDIILQRKTKIEVTDDAKSLLLKLDELAFDGFSEIWQKRHEWTKIAKKQTGRSSYHSRRDFVHTNIIDLNETVRTGEFLDFLRSRTFGDFTNAYFIDDAGDKYLVAIKVVKA